MGDLLTVYMTCSLIEWQETEFWTSKKLPPPKKYISTNLEKLCEFSYDDLEFLTNNTPTTEFHHRKVPDRFCKIAPPACTGHSCEVFQTWIFNPRHPKSSKYLVSRCLEPLKTEPQEMFGGSNTYSQGIWMSKTNNAMFLRYNTLRKKHYVIVASLPDIFFRVKCQMYIFCCASLDPTDVKVKNTFVVPNLIFHTPVHLKATTHSIRSSFLTTRWHPASTRQLHLSRSQVCCFSAPCLVNKPLDHEMVLKKTEEESATTTALCY